MLLIFKLFLLGIASGFPFAGIVSRKDLHKNLVKGSMGGTYGANAVGCAASVATIDAIEDEKILDNALQRGSYIMVSKVLLIRYLAYERIVDTIASIINLILL